MKPAVVIIGAGVSGLAAAVKLIENGFENVKVLEVNDRIGGRVHSTSFGSDGTVIDLGAQWIQGENCIYDFVFGHIALGDTNWTNETTAFLTSDKESVDKKLFDKLNDLAEEIESLREEMFASSETYGEFFTRKYYENLEKDPSLANVDEKLIKQMLYLHHTYFNALFASTDWNEVPVKSFAAVESSEGNQFITWKNRGFSTIFDFLKVNRFF